MGKKEFFRYFFKTPDRKLGAASLIATILTILLQIILLLKNSTDPVYIVIRDVLVISILVAIIILLCVKYVRKAYFLEDFRDNLGYETKVSHDTIHKCRDIFFHHLYPRILSEKPVSADEINEINEKSIKKIFRTVLNDHKGLLISYFHSRGFKIKETDLTLTIKALVTKEDAQKIMDIQKQEKAVQLSDGETYLITAYRDYDTFQSKDKSEREVAGKVFAVSENTAFNDIFEHCQPHFTSNDLSKHQSYRNTTPSWQQQYNSTQLVPIRYYNPNKNEKQFFGAIAVDSLNLKGYTLFDESVTFNILSHAADVLAVFFGISDIAGRVVDINSLKQKKGA